MASYESSAADGGCRCARSAAGPRPPSAREERPSDQHRLATSRRLREQFGQVEAGAGEPLRMRGPTLGPDQLVAARGEDVRGLDDVALDAAGHGEDLAHLAVALRVTRGVDNEVDAARDGRYDECVSNVLAREQWKSAYLRHSLACRVPVDRAHAREPGVERDEQ